jgi:hypothetical protein
MTPQEEELLVQIIVQCVRAVLETAEQESAFTRPESKPGVATSGARFIDVVPRQDTNISLLNSGQDGHVRDAADRNRDDVRESLRRFLRESEPPAAGIWQIQMQPQKRQLITREDVLAALRQGVKVIALQPDAVVTPLARQVAKEKGIELR